MLTNEQRQHIVDVAKCWIGTPYRGWSCVKGAGVDCGQLLKGVFEEAGHCNDGITLPENYSLQVFQHRKDTTYIDYVNKYMREITEAEALPGDVVVYRLGLAFAHAAIVVAWPEHIIHAVEFQGVISGHGKNFKFGRLEKRFFTLRDEYVGGE
jgi:cell wall-associated NlpC family hydrolase